MNSIHLSMPVSDYFGCGVCGANLLREFSLRMPVFYDPGCGECVTEDETVKMLALEQTYPLTANVNRPLLQFAGPQLEQQTAYRGRPNAAYFFFETESLTDKQRENLKAFDVLIAGSQWNADIVAAAGFNCHAVAQGVDRTIFKPMPRRVMKDKFIIFSGGKWEHRKGQDLVIRAVRALQQRHDDIVLMASWFNIWDNSAHYEEARKHGLRTIELPLCSHAELAEHMNQTDVGLFPNRAEGGTNLVMMEYMACGKPVVAANTTGQKDVLSTGYAIYANGTDADRVEQMIEGVEYLYSHPITRAQMGNAADLAMGRWSWGRTADDIESAIDRVTEGAHA